MLRFWKKIIDLHYFEYKSITIFFIFIVVLLVSTDPAHSLSDAFRCQFGAEPISPNENALPNLDVMELDPTVTVEVLTTLRSHILVNLLNFMVMLFVFIVNICLYITIITDRTRFMGCSCKGFSWC